MAFFSHHIWALGTSTWLMYSVLWYGTLMIVNVELAEGKDLAHAVIRAGAVRAKPIVLTAVAAMMGAFFILDDPIFNGLAVSLIFGIFVSTLLTLLVIPILYFSYRRRLKQG